MNFSIKTSIAIFFIVVGNQTFAQSNFYKYTEEAYYYFQQNDLVNAIKKFSKALEYKNEVTNSYKIADTYISRGLCRQQLSNFESAQADYDEALKIKPEYVKAYQVKSASYMSALQFQNAIDCTNKGLDIKPNDIGLRSIKSEGLSRLKKYDDAIVILFSILEDNPKNKNAFRSLGNNYQMKKNWDSALKYFSTAIILDPLDFASFFDRGIAFAESKDTISAIKDIEQAMKLDTAKRYIGFNNIGYFVRLGQKDYKGAIAMFDKAIQLNPEFAYAYSNRGFAKLNLGDMKGAYQDVKKSLLMNNKNSYAYKNLALIYLKDGKKSDACYNLKKAIEYGYTEQYDDEVKNLLSENCK